jgi:hypothetical protein
VVSGVWWAARAAAIAAGASDPFVSVRIDLEAAKKAKSTYPRYALSGSFPLTQH